MVMKLADIFIHILLNSYRSLAQSYNLKNKILVIIEKVLQIFIFYHSYRTFNTRCSVNRIEPSRKKPHNVRNNENRFA